MTIIKELIVKCNAEGCHRSYHVRTDNIVTARGEAKREGWTYEGYSQGGPPGGSKSEDWCPNHGRFHVR